MQSRGKSFAGEASDNKGQEFRRRDGSRVWYNVSPYFRVYFFPGQQGDKQEVWYRLWDSEVIITGWNLLDIYEHLKNNLPETLEESQGVYDPASETPYILAIKHNDRP
jgi:hypothetical protein